MLNCNRGETDANTRRRRYVQHERRFANGSQPAFRLP